MYIHVLVYIEFTLHSKLLDDVLPVLSHFSAPAEASHKLSR